MVPPFLSFLMFCASLNPPKTNRSYSKVVKLILKKDAFIGI